MQLPSTLTNAAAATDRGPVREVNEDRVLCDERVGLYAVLDGVGGHNAGEVAAQLALETLVAYVAHSPTSDDDTWPLGWDRRYSVTSNRLRTAVILANRRVYEAAQSDPALSGMATTISAVLVSGSVLSLVNVGDSRIYRVEPGPPRQLTSDDVTMVDQVDANGDRVGSRRALTRALGAESEVTPSLAEMPIPGAVRLVLCSDGLHGVVGLEDLPAPEYSGSPRQVAERLLTKAIESGTRDNVSVLVLDVGERA